MKASKEEFIRGGGGFPHCAGLAYCTHPKVQNPCIDENSNKMGDHY